MTLNFKTLERFFPNKIIKTKNSIDASIREIGNQDLLEMVLGEKNIAEFDKFDFGFSEIIEKNSSFLNSEFQNIKSIIFNSFRSPGFYFRFHPGVNFILSPDSSLFYLMKFAFASRFYNNIKEESEIEFTVDDSKFNFQRKPVNTIGHKYILNSQSINNISEARVKLSEITNILDSSNDYQNYGYNGELQYIFPDLSESQRDKFPFILNNLFEIYFFGNQEQKREVLCINLIDQYLNKIRDEINDKMHWIQNNLTKIFSLDLHKKNLMKQLAQIDLDYGEYQEKTSKEIDVLITEIEASNIDIENILKQDEEQKTDVSQKLQSIIQQKKDLDIENLRLSDKISQKKLALRDIQDKQCQLEVQNVHLGRSHKEICVCNGCHKKLIHAVLKDRDDREVCRICGISKRDIKKEIEKSSEVNRKIKNYQNSSDQLATDIELHEERQIQITEKINNLDEQIKGFQGESFENPFKKYAKTDIVNLMRDNYKKLAILHNLGQKIDEKSNLSTEFANITDEMNTTIDKNLQLTKLKDKLKKRESAIITTLNSRKENLLDEFKDKKDILGKRIDELRATYRIPEEIIEFSNPKTISRLNFTPYKGKEIRPVNPLLDQLGYFFSILSLYAENLIDFPGLMIIRGVNATNLIKYKENIDKIHTLSEKIQIFFIVEGSDQGKVQEIWPDLICKNKLKDLVS